MSLMVGQWEDTVNYVNKPSTIYNFQFHFFEQKALTFNFKRTKYFTIFMLLPGPGKRNLFFQSDTVYMCSRLGC